MIQKHIFPNGLELIYQPSIQSIPISTIYIFCKVGSAHETNDMRGASHFIEHMCFKGTKLKIVKNLLHYFNTIGAKINATTEKNFTCYKIDCNDPFLEDSYHFLMNMLLHSVFPKNEFKKEQNVVIEENIMNKDNYSNLIYEYAESIYYKGSSYQYPIDTISYHKKYFNYDDIYSWYKKCYVPSNMIVSIVSQVPFSRIKNMIEKTNKIGKIGKIDKIGEIGKIVNPINLYLLPITFSVKYFYKKGMKSTAVHVGFRTCDYNSKDKYKLQLLQTIMNSISGRLFTNFRTKRGLTYSSSCVVDNNINTGYFAIDLVTDPEKLVHVLHVLIRILHDLKKGVTDEEIDVAKIIMKSDILGSMESINTITSYNGIDYIFSGEIIPLNDLYSRRFSRITKKQVNDVIHRYFIRDNMVACILYDKDIPVRTINGIFDKV